MNPLAHWNQLRLNQLDELDDLRHRLRNLVRHSPTRTTGDKVRVAQDHQPNGQVSSARNPKASIEKFR